MADAVTTLAQARLAWHATLSEEDSAKVIADRAALSDEATKAERMAEMAATFTAADTNSDGLLDRAEMADFLAKLGQNAAARGVPHMSEADITEEQKEAVWAYFNGLTGGTDGVSQADFMAGSQAIATKIREIRDQ